MTVNGVCKVTYRKHRKEIDLPKSISSSVISLSLTK